MYDSGITACRHVGQMIGSYFRETLDIILNFPGSRF